MPDSSPAPGAVLGLDPGSRRTGYAILLPGRPRAILVAAGSIAAPARLAVPQRLGIMHQDLSRLIALHRPAEMAVEEVFSMVNVRSALVLGQARGVALLAGAQAGLAIYEYAATSVKKALVGFGRAPKEQVRAMVVRLLGDEAPEDLDASDACALALTHLQTRNLAIRLEGAR